MNDDYGPSIWFVSVVMAFVLCKDCGQRHDRRIVKLNPVLGMWNAPDGHAYSPIGAEEQLQAADALAKAAQNYEKAVYDFNQSFDVQENIGWSTANALEQTRRELEASLAAYERLRGRNDSDNEEARGK